MQSTSSNEQVNESLKEIKHQIDVLKDHLKKNPKDYTIMFALALRHHKLDEFRACSAICHKLADLGAEQVEIYDLGARSDITSGFYKSAIDILKKGLERFPDNYNLKIQMATALHRIGDNEKAENFYTEAQNISSDDPTSCVAMGNFLANTGRVPEALQMLEDGLQRFPDSVLILNNLGTLYSRLDQELTASEYFIKALRLEPTNVSCLVNLAGTFQMLKKADIAIKFFDEALKIDPNHPSAVCGKAGMLSNYGMGQENIGDLKKGLDLYRKSFDVSNASYINHFSNLVFFLHYVPNVARKEIFDTILEWQKELCSDVTEKPSLDFENNADRNKKIRLGLNSKGFCVHPVGQMIYAALENLDKEKFEIYCYSELPEGKRDYLTDKIFDLSQKVTNINNEANHNLVEIIRNDGIDILIEMTGHSEGGRRLQMIAERAAPVQVKWVGGLFNTSGVPQMDWLITDNIETPEGDEKWYTEKLYRMPDDYIVYNPPFYAPRVLDLPVKKNGYITFGNLNNLAKTNSYSIGIWSKILKAVPNSKLLLKGNKMDTPFVQEHLIKSFNENGIDADRLLIEGGEDHQKFLHVYNRIDIALDSHPYTGGLTTCEALWMGVPVVTLPSETFAGRHAATHLTNAGMPEWIAQDEQDYIDIAVKWANDIDSLAKLRAGMRKHVSKTPLVDGPRFAKNLEIALCHMWSEWCDAKEAANKPKKVSKPKPKKSKKRK